MRLRAAFRSLAAFAPTTSLLALLALVALAAFGCADPRYCDADTPCQDQAYPYCDLLLHECQSTQWDGGLDAAGDVKTDGHDGQADGQTDGQTDAPPADDGGCEAPQHQCGGYCYDLDDPAHCGESCLECTAPAHGTPTCDGTACDFTCNATYYLNAAACDACAVAAHCGPTCADCTATPTTPDCSGHTGKCVCNPTSCGATTTPICDATSGACRACQEHSECASGACNRTTGACVPEADIIYLGVTNCSDADTGTQAQPFCNPGVALGAVTTSRWRIVAAAHTYAIAASMLIINKTVEIIGSTTGTTEINQITSSLPVFDIQGTADVTLHRITVKGTGTDGLLCNGLSSTATLRFERGTIGPNAAGRGIDATRCTVTVQQSIIKENKGGGLSLSNGAFIVQNCLVVGNGKSGGAGTTFGGVYVINPGSPADLINNTVVANLAKGGATGGVLCSGGGKVVNSIIYDNEVAQQKDCTVEYSDVEGWTGGGPGNISDDPLFVDVATDNYHLKTSPTSPAINAGTSAGAPNVDLEGNARTNTPDMGCYEAQ